MAYCYKSASQANVVVYDDAHAVLFTNVMGVVSNNRKNVNKRPPLVSFLFSTGAMNRSFALIEQIV